MLIVENSVQNCQVRPVQFLKIVFVYFQVVCNENFLEHFPFFGCVLQSYGKHVDGATQKEYWKTFITTPLDGNGLRTILKYEKKVIAEG